MTIRKCTLAIAFVALAFSTTFAAGRTMLAVPARHDMVGFGFDLLRQLPGQLELACYKGDDRIERLEVFDQTAREWTTISTEAWASGAYRADSLVIAGESAAAAQLQGLSGWTRQATTTSDRDKLGVTKAVHSYQPLSEQQWLAIGNAYGFKFQKVAAPSARERLRDQARARRAAEKAQKEERLRARAEAEAAGKARRGSTGA